MKIEIDHAGNDLIAGKIVTSFSEIEIYFVKKDFDQLKELGFFINGTSSLIYAQK